MPSYASIATEVADFATADKALHGKRLDHSRVEIALTTGLRELFDMSLPRSRRRAEAVHLAADAVRYVAELFDEE